MAEQEIDDGVRHIENAELLFYKTALIKLLCPRYYLPVTSF